MKFVVVDLSGSISHQDLAAYCAAQQEQLRGHYSNCYDQDAYYDQVRMATPRVPARPGEVGIFLHPDSSQAPEDALGVHELSKAGVPLAHVYLDLAKQSGDPWQSIASHEALEARADPRLRLCVELDDGSIWDREICDRVEADTYQVLGVPMSNFNTPECFEPTPGLVQKYDWMGLSTSPNEIRPGGYAQKYDPAKGWTMVGAMRPYRAAVHALGRTRAARRLARAARAR